MNAAHLDGTRRAAARPRRRDPMNTCAEETTANLARAAALDPASAAAYLDELLASCEQQMVVLETGEGLLQTMSDVREHEAARAALERDHEAYAAARAAVGQTRVK